MGPNRVQVALITHAKVHRAPFFHTNRRLSRFAGKPVS